MDVIVVLFSQLKLTYPGCSSSKKHLSTSKIVLEQIVNCHPIVEKIIQYRRVKHVVTVSTQILIPLQRCVENDGKVRTCCQMNTATGRILCFDPNIQTVSKENIIDNIGPRHLFKARTGCVLISADYSQLELRVLAHLSGDLNLIALLKNDGDVFTNMSSNLCISRDIVKKLCYGIIYGMGAKSLAETVNKTSDEAHDLILKFFRSFPKVRSYINSIKEQATAYGFVSTILGRRRVTCNVRGRQEDVAKDDRQSINYTIQGTASEIFKKAVIGLDKYFQDSARIVLMIHDEVIIECATKDEDHVKQWTRTIMESVFEEFSVPLPVKIRSGPSWGFLS
ncbi:DNA-directed DNA polymerase [Dictyocaulus viviparus]|uniref:DNA-directed DNA polymerase n=1 Tax=Dictyocaulus viviparus TaxID=29172 RepID=A0A0D8XI66_DICVI|nr:DNA-directed DNA polymerase [Dictyocaulus viviparus]